MSNRVTVMLLVALIAGVGSAWALDCADYISGSMNDEPLTGHLIGEQLVTEAFEFGVDAGAHAGITGTVQYRVGIYSMSDGTNLWIDCRDYSVA